MKDLKYYKEIFCSSELELYFMEENGSCSFVKRRYDYIYRYEEAIVATNALMPLVDYPSSDDSLTIVDRVAFLFGTSDGYYRFTNMCETNKIDIKEINEEKQYCYKYPHPSITTDCVIFGYDVKDGLSLLLIERKTEPFKGRWAFPGGFMHIDEDTESCARRELQEETALVVAVLEQLGCYSDVNRDPRERVVTIAYYGIIKKSNVVGGDDAKDARWFALNEIPTLAFDHDRI